jgi:hypothetical protein
MTVQLAASFSDPASDLHCFARGGLALALGASANGESAAAELGQVGDRFVLRVPGICDATLEPLGAPIALAGERSEWLCRLSGSGRAGARLEGFGAVTATAAGARQPILRRSLWICFAGELAFSVEAELERRGGGHGDERVVAFLASGTPLAAAAVEEPRLSSTYREDGQLLRAGIELWEAGEEQDQESARDRHRALRLAGETIAAGALGDDTSVAFLAWHFDGRRGVGAYAIERAGG